MKSILRKKNGCKKFNSMLKEPIPKEKQEENAVCSS